MMEILIKKIENGSILYLKTLTGQNIEAETVNSPEQEKKILNNWLEEHNIIKFNDERVNEIYYNVNDVSPLIMVFYLDKELMGNPEIMGPFSEGVNNLFHDRKVNAIAFFMPTEGNERIECLNPTILPKVEVDKIDVIIDDLKKNFSVG